MVKACWAKLVGAWYADRRQFSLTHAGDVGWPGQTTGWWLERFELKINSWVNYLSKTANLA